MRRWTAQGVVAVILAAALGGAFVAVYIIAALTERHVSDAAISAVEHLGTLLATGLAGWLGGSAVAKDRDNRPHL